MKFIKRFLLALLAIIILLNLLIIVFDKTYLYKGIELTYMRGEKTATIDDAQFFDTRTVEAGNYQPWSVADDYNSLKLPENLTTDLERLEAVAFLVIKNDSIQYEQYWDGYNADSASNSFSMAKSIVSILVGIALEEGKIKNILQPASDFIPEFKELEFQEELTIKSLLAMGSGLDWEESYTGPLSITAEAYYGDHLEEIIRGLKLKERPGQKFKYLSGNTAVLGLILEEATGMTLSEYASEKLWKPIGAKHDAKWTLDKEGGMEKPYCCFNSNARDFARLGKLYLNDGMWNGAQIVPEYYVRGSTISQGLVGHYGLHWWIIEGYETPIFYARGHLGQYVIVFPEKDMIVVRLGKHSDVSEDGKHYNDVHLIVQETLKMFPDA